MGIQSVFGDRVGRGIGDHDLSDLVLDGPVCGQQDLRIPTSV